MLCCLFAPLLVGGLAGGVAGNPKRRRPIVRGLVKNGIAVKRRLTTASAAAWMETRNLVDEARAELDHPGTERRY